MRTFLKILTIFIAVGAIGGAVMMWMDPTGVSWGGAPMLEILRAKMPWPEVFFRDFIPSGFALLAVNGLPQLLAALMLFKKHPCAYRVTQACSIILMDTPHAAVLLRVTEGTLPTYRSTHEKQTAPTSVLCHRTRCS